MPAPTIEEKIATLREYLFLKYNEEDWRAVAEAANDIRVLVNCRYRCRSEYDSERTNNAKHFADYPAGSA